MNRLKLTLLATFFFFALVGGFHKATQVTYAQGARTELVVGASHASLLPSLMIQSARADEPAPSPSPSPALEEPKDLAGAISLGSMVLSIIKNKQWALLAAVLLMLAVWAFRVLLLPKLAFGPEKLPLITAIMACVGGVSAGLWMGQGFVESLVGAFFVGAAASGLWSQVFKAFLPTPANEFKAK